MQPAWEMVFERFQYQQSGWVAEVAQFKHILKETASKLQQVTLSQFPHQVGSLLVSGLRGEMRKGRALHFVRGPGAVWVEMEVC